MGLETGCNAGFQTGYGEGSAAFCIEQGTYSNEDSATDFGAGLANGFDAGSATYNDLGSVID